MPIRRLLVLGSMLALSSLCCSNEDNKTPSGPDPATPFPYAVPSAAAVQMEIGDLASSSGQARTGLCHAITALFVTWVNVNVAVRLAIPTLVLNDCLHQTPIYLGNNTWRWTATGGVGTNAWAGELTAIVAEGGRVDWFMRISGTPLDLDRFLWFDGGCDTTAYSGIWHYFDPNSPQEEMEVIRCTWSLPRSPAEAHTLLFENVTEGQPESGDRLEYGLVDSVASMSIRDESEGATTQTRWDLRTGAGMTVNAQADSCCWGDRPLYPDVPCP